MVYKYFFFIVFCLGLQSQGYSYHNTNDPILFGIDTSVPFNQISSSAFLNKQPWAGSYWPLYKGGISHRWQDGTESLRLNDHLYKTLDETDSSVFQLNDVELASLSPSEKYDVFSGNYDFLLTKAEQKSAMSFALPTEQGLQVPLHYGYSHGWAAAAINEIEPLKPVDIHLRHGAKLKFYPSDIKALLSSYYANAPADTISIGSACNTHLNGRLLLDYFNSREPPRCNHSAINPALFHLAATSSIQGNKSFVIEFSKNLEKKEQPIFGYRYMVLNTKNTYKTLRSGLFGRRRTKKKTGSKVTVQMQLYVTSIQPALSENHNSMDEHLYNYELTLNLHQQITGGRWLMRNQPQPELLWLQKRIGFDSRGLINYQKLKELHRKSI